VAQCYELLQGVTGGASYFTGNTVYPVNVDLSQCMTAAAQNPWGNPVVGHFVGFNSEEYTAFAATPTLQDIFTMPIASDLAQMWFLGFGLPVICYLTAWGYGVVINWFNERHDHY
jgi:hypothetical protein